MLLEVVEAELTLLELMAQWHVFSFLTGNLNVLFYSFAQSILH